MRLQYTPLTQYQLPRLSDEIARVSHEDKARILRKAAQVVHHSLHKDGDEWDHDGGCHAIGTAAARLEASYTEEHAAYCTFRMLFNNPLAPYWFGFPRCGDLTQAINMRDHRVYALLLAAEFALTEGAI